ncbi:hypothetical protein [Burkholderia ambifaria]|nr:hypothetical protein [Burkholderia ambifaria]
MRAGPISSLLRLVDAVQSQRLDVVVFDALGNPLPDAGPITR